MLAASRMAFRAAASAASVMLAAKSMSGKDSKSSSSLMGEGFMVKLEAKRCSLTGLGTLDVEGDVGAETPAAKKSFLA